MENRKEVLNQVLCNVFETLAFMFGDVSDDETELTGEVAAVACMQFSGDATGSLEIAVPVPMCAVIACNVLGVDPGDSLVKEQELDALKEVLNIICGNLLVEIVGDEAIVDLTVPETSQIDRAGWLTMQDDPVCEAFVVDDYPVLLRLVMAS